MEILNTEEITCVSGGMIQADGGGDTGGVAHWYDGFVNWFHGHFGGGGGGLSQPQAMQACQDLGRGLNTALSGTLKKMYPGPEVTKACQTAVHHTINYEDSMPAAVCVQVDQGKWDALSRRCIY